MEKILCCNVLHTERAHKDNIFRHPLFSHEEALPWPPANWRELCCWHCCHACPSDPICLPNSYDRRADVFHVFGLFCSLQCAKAYLLEHSAFGSGDRALLLQYLATRFFGHSGAPARPAPPRHRLRMFGGDLSIEDFRKEHEFLTTVLTPPLISTPEVYERTAGVAAASCWVAARPGAPAPPAAPAAATPSLFSNFLKQKRAAPAAEAKQLEEVPGTLCVFMKKRRPAAAA
jgi:hypothetical protein